MRSPDSFGQVVHTDGTPWHQILPFCQCMVAGWTPETKLTYLQWQLGEFTYISEDEAERLGKQHMLICKREDQNGKTKAG